MSASRTDRIAYLAIVLFVVGLVLFGWQYHPIEEINSPENDGYVDKADQIRAGEIPKDVFHPLLYPIASAGLGAILNDTFAGARLASAMLAGLFVLFTYLLGRSWFGREVGLFAAAGAMLNYNVIVAGVHAATDAAFSAFAVLVLLLAFTADKKPSCVTALVLGLSFSLAYFSRYNGITLLPTIVIALVTLPSSACRKLTALAAFAVSSVVFLLPHFFLTSRAFGSPFYHESYKTLAFKLYGNGDWGYFNNVPFDGLMSVISHSPARVVSSTLREMAGFLNSGLIGLGGDWLAGGLFAASFLAGLYTSLRAADRKMVLALSFIFFYVMAIAIMYETRRRYLLPILPLGYILGGKFLLTDAFAGFIRLGRIHVRRQVPVVVVFLAVTGGSTLRDLPSFIERHPVEEVRAGLMLQEKYGSDIKVLGTFPFIQRHVKYWYEELEDAYGDEKRSGEKYYAKLKSLLKYEHIDYVIIGKLTIRDRPRALLKNSHVPPFLSIAFRSEDVSVYKVIGSELE